MAYCAGIIERWGSGTLNIIDWCMENGNPAPTWSEHAGSVFVTFLPALLETPQDMGHGTGEIKPQDAHVAPHVAPQVTPQVFRLLTAMKGTEDRDTLQLKLGLKARKNFRLLYLAPALNAGLIEMTIPDKPRSSKQRYRLTPKGKAWISEYHKEKER